jgi:hypothetical protein
MATKPKEKGVYTWVFLIISMLHWLLHDELPSVDFELLFHLFSLIYCMWGCNSGVKNVQLNKLNNIIIFVDDPWM